MKTDIDFVLGSLDEHTTEQSAPAAETALVVSCSMCRCEHGERLWPVDPSWNVVGVQTLGNRVRDQYDGEVVLDGTLAHLTREYDVAAVLVVGHTTCDVVADACDHCLAVDSPASVITRVRPLVDTALEEGIVDESTPPREARYRLVEYNVRRQVAFLREQLPESITTVGYVYDQDGAYSTFPEKHYLVTLDGETAASAPLPDDTSARVASLL